MFGQFLPLTTKLIVPRFIYVNCGDSTRLLDPIEREEALLRLLKSKPEGKGEATEYKGRDEAGATGPEYSAHSQLKLNVIQSGAA